MTDRPYIAVLGAAEAREKEVLLAERVGGAPQGLPLTPGGRRLRLILDPLGPRWVSPLSGVGRPLRTRSLNWSSQSS